MHIPTPFPSLREFSRPGAIVLAAACGAIVLAVAPALAEGAWLPALAELVAECPTGGDSRQAEIVAAETPFDAIDELSPGDAFRVRVTRTGGAARPVADASALDGEWTGPSWGTVVLSGGSGTYTDTWERDFGTLNLAAVGPGIFRGRWHEEGVYGGDIVFVLCADGRTTVGRWIVDASSDYAPGRNGTANWSRTGAGPVASPGEGNDTEGIPVSIRAVRSGDAITVTARPTDEADVFLSDVIRLRRTTP